MAENSTIMAENATTMVESATFMAVNATSIAENATSMAENATIMADNATIIAENATIMAENATTMPESATSAGENFISAMGYCLTVFCSIAAFENLLVLLVFARTRRLRTKHYIFIVNLALADFLFAATQVAGLWEPQAVLSAFVVACYTVSILTILAVAVNRYLFLSFLSSSRYDARVTGYILIVVCIVIWCVSSTYVVLIYVVLSPEVAFVLHFLVYALVVIILCIIIGLLYCMAFRMIKLYNPTGSGDNPNIEDDESTVRQTQHILVTFVFIFAASLLTWLPFGILRLIFYFDYPSPLDYSPYFWGTAFVYSLSTLINPMIYWWRMEGFRGGFYGMFCPCVVRAKLKEADAKQNANEPTTAEAGF